MKFGHRSIVIAAVALVACQDSPVTAPEAPELHRGRDYDSERVYEVTIENLTTSQPFSPGVAVTHSGGYGDYWHRNGHRDSQLFRPGRPASEGLRNIAENGDPSVAVAELTGASGVFDVVATTAPIHRIGGPGETSLTFQVKAKHRSSRLSLAVMLICTNDGFVGIRNLRLPRGSYPVTAYARAYDSGTEANDELHDSIVPPCGGIGPVSFDNLNNNRTPEDGRVRPHRGILGVGELDPSAHNWKGPVAKVTVRLITP